jgi:hypothetical protein
VALLVAGSLVWFLASAWFPVARAAIARLPETGRIAAGELSLPESPPEQPLAASRHVSFTVDADLGVRATPAGDVAWQFRRRHLDICSLLGCLRIEYPRGKVAGFNRPDLTAWLDAWQPFLLAAAGLGTAAGLMLSWMVLATIYFPAAQIVAFYKDRRLTSRGAWKLSAMSLLPAALLVAGAVIGYGLGAVDLIRLLGAWVLHFPVGWLCLALLIARLPLEQSVSPAGSNPFAASAEEASPNALAHADRTASVPPPDARG